MKKVVLIFSGYYLPAKNYGGPITSIKNIVDTCSDHFDFFIVASNRDFGGSSRFVNVHNGWNKVGKASVLYIEASQYNYNFKKVKGIIKEVQASLVCLTGIFRPEIKWCAITACRQLNTPILLSPRGEVSDNAFAMKRYKKQPYASFATLVGLFRDVMFHATSEAEKAGLMRHFLIPERNIYLVPNIAKRYSPRLKPIKEAGKVKIVFISRIQRSKNLKYAIEVANSLTCEATFDIYGPMESQDYWDECMSIIKESPDNISINYLGALEPDSVGSTFGKYDCFLFPTLTENYGHVIVEAMLNDCPVVLSKGTTPWDDLESFTGLVKQLDDREGFIGCLSMIAQMDNAQYCSLLDSNRRYILGREVDDDAIRGHIDMFTAAISRFN